MTPPPGYLLHCLRVVAVLLLGGYALLRIFTWTRDAHKVRRKR